MRKFMITAAAVLALAAPTAALAGGNTGVSTNDNTKDAIGWCVSAGNYNYLNGIDPLPTTGADRSSRAGDPGANADLIAGARAACAAQTPYAPPGQ